MPEELLRNWDEPYIDDKGKRKTRSVCLMLRREIPQFRTPFLMRCIDMYNNWRLFNKVPPCGDGWANERGVTCRILQLLEIENNKYDAWERDRERQREEAKKGR